MAASASSLPIDEPDQDMTKAGSSREQETTRRPRLRRRAAFTPLHKSLPSPSSSVSSIDSDSVFGEWRGRRTRSACGGSATWLCDEAELERHASEHWMFRMLLGWPFWGPTHEVIGDEQGRWKRVLDVGTGCGVWAIDMAELFPEAQVVGLDTAPLHQSMVPENCEFELGDLDSGLDYYDDETWDVVRLAFAHLRVPDFEALLHAAFRLLRPLGVLLVLDTGHLPVLADGTSTVGVRAWTDALTRSVMQAGMKPFDLETVLEVFHGQDVAGFDVRVPLGRGQGHVKSIGSLHLANATVFLDTARHVMIQSGGYSDAEVDVLSRAWLGDVQDKEMFIRYHALSIQKAPQKS